MFSELLKFFQKEGSYLCPLYPSEFVFRNIFCAALKIVREEAQRLASGSDNLNSFDSLTVRSIYNYRRKMSLGILSVVYITNYFQKLWIDPKNSRLTA